MSIIFHIEEEENARLGDGSHDSGLRGIGVQTKFRELRLLTPLFSLQNNLRI